MTHRHGHEGKRYGTVFIPPDTWLPPWPPRGPEWEGDETVAVLAIAVPPTSRDVPAPSRDPVRTVLPTRHAQGPLDRMTSVGLALHKGQRGAD